jgi:3-phytase
MRIRPPEKIRGLSFFSDQNIVSQATYEGIPVGGLSGIRFFNDKLYAISDDRSEHGPARIYVFDIVQEKERFEFKVSGQIILKDQSGKTFKSNTIDFEGLAIMDDGSFLVSTEGVFKKKINPEIFLFSKEGLLLKRMGLPGKFNPSYHDSDAKGTRDNLALESLTRGKNDGHFFTATEEALEQDGSVSTDSHASLIRIVEFRNQSPIGEYAYQNSHLPNPQKVKKISGINGLVDLAYLGKRQLIAVERAWTPETKKQTIRLFKISLDQASDVSGYKGLVNKRFSPVKKELLLDLDQIVDKLDPKFKRLDNIEGICFGPRLRDGSPSLILVSDNNFSKYQRTLFLVLKIHD